MRAITPRCRHFSSAKQLKDLVSSSSTPKPEFLHSILSEDLCGEILNQYPDIRTLKKLHSKILNNRHLRFNPTIAIKLMRAYAACGDPAVARHIFDEMTEKNIVFFNVMIRSYVGNGCYHDALLMFKEVSSHGLRPDHYTYPCVLKACSRSDNLRVGLQIHGDVVKVGLDLNLFIGNGLIAMYSKCRFLVQARRAFDEMPIRDIVSWNSMVSGYAQNECFDQALVVCREMKLLGIKPDAGTMSSLLPAVTNTSSDNISFVKEMFSKLARKSVVPWNVMISIFVNNSLSSEAVDLFSQMEAYGIEPDSFTIASILPACGDLSAIFLGRRIHEYINRKKLFLNLALDNALIDMYAKCGCLKEAKAVFDQMKFRDIVSWTSMISAYGMSGQGDKAMSLFSKMQNSGLTPDSIAFVSVLSACSHAGLLDQGWYFFNLMTDQHKILPRVEHFACMVDLLGRSGQVEEAYNFIRKMPIEHTERIWGTLLGACWMHSNMNIGLLAADHLFRLAPEPSGYYVLLSNIYAKAGRWEDVTTVRSIMKSKGIKKMAGASNTEIDNQVYTFLAGDQSHPQSREIYKKLDFLVGKIKEAGYVPETQSALHDVEEEDKEGHLAVHSEKLAIVFAILNTKPGTPIRITKNLRICGDCHVAAKLISQITEREIIVRDTYRFHHFQYGVCSCGDYW
ncbi:putative pentatricopeptide repeat-containing protein [Hibiscus syriacus]|uniref:Pentatricopeptide repeat-containing protein n=1 Tax=Hibiscus syriacus TaxID=106335 RepID=A0A6A3BN47_HIBSY|nr:putative pentatricopeptide repeat-containing protein At3g49142 [Hibiscus syriacus]KAE8717467.1 putative pentatricopeptide repeat-containing protein [Hibiscus syriacus]